MRRSGLVHTAGVTTGKVHDAKVMDNLIREDDRAVYGDKGYVNEKKKRAARGRRRLLGGQGESQSRAAAVVIAEANATARTARSAPRSSTSSAFSNASSAIARSAIAASPKNGAQVFALLALANLFLARRQLTCA